MSLLTTSTVGPLAVAIRPRTPAWQRCSLEVGALQVLLGVLRAGVLVDLLSHPVTGGSPPGPRW